MEIKLTPEFKAWLDGLRDAKAQVVIAKRIARFEAGALGDIKSVGGGVLEARIHYGPGYRLYFIIRGDELIIMLIGGDKSLQVRDIERAKELAKLYQ